MIGERLGNWVLDVEIAQNDMGRLFRAHAVDDPSRRAALKWITHPKTKSAEFQKLFLAQIDLLHRLNHPAIVAILDGGQFNGRSCYVMEWIDGSDFQTLLGNGERVPWNEALAIALQIVPALRHAHRRGVLHRGIKPSNLFRCTDGAAKLADFGVTKFFGDAAPANADKMLESASYFSPEQAAGTAYTKRSDFYSLGCLLYALVVGRPPFAANTGAELVHKHHFVLPERPIHFVPDLPEEFDQFIMRLLAKEPAQRPGSGTSLIQELDAIWNMLERKGVVGHRPVLVKVEDDAEAALVREVLFAAQPPEPSRRRRRPLWRRWYVAAPVFTACVLLPLWAFWWREPSADELMLKARPLLASENPADWDKAWTEYLEPLSRKYPDQFQDQVREARALITEKSDLNQALAGADSIDYDSQSERFYHKGLQLLQSGEWAAARRVWENVVAAFERVESEKHWVVLARHALQRTENRASPTLRSVNAVQTLEDQLRPVVDELRRLRGEESQEAEAMERALLSLYRDTPEIEEVRLMIAPHVR